VKVLIRKRAGKRLHRKPYLAHVPVWLYDVADTEQAIHDSTQAEAHIVRCSGIDRVSAAGAKAMGVKRHRLRPLEKMLVVMPAKFTSGKLRLRKQQTFVLSEVRKLLATSPKRRRMSAIYVDSVNRRLPRSVCAALSGFPKRYFHPPDSTHRKVAKFYDQWCAQLRRDNLGLKPDWKRIPGKHQGTAPDGVLESHFLAACRGPLGMSDATVRRVQQQIDEIVAGVPREAVKNARTALDVKRRGGRGGGRPVATAEDVSQDARTLRDYEATGLRIKEFAQARDIPASTLKRTIKRARMRKSRGLRSR
jgi:hypothetical protein